MLTELNSFLAQYSALISLSSFIAGLFCGFKIALLIEDKKEWNRAREPIRAWLFKQLEDPSTEYPMPDIAQFDLLHQYTPWYHRRWLSRDWDTQKEQLKNCYTHNPWGSSEFKNSPERIATLQRILKYTR